MARTITFEPSKELSEFIHELIETGGYRTASEVVRDGLRLLQEQWATSNLNQLRELIDEGEKSGDPVTWDLEDFLSRMKRLHAKQII